jgi:hypothetical protein
MTRNEFGDYVDDDHESLTEVGRTADHRRPVRRQTGADAPAKRRS